MNSFGGLHIYLRIALSTHTEHHGILTASLFHHLPCEESSKNPEQQQWKNNRHQKAHKWRCPRLDFFRELRTAVIEPLCQVIVRHESGLVDCALRLIRKCDLCTVDLYLTDILILGHLHKCSVVNFLYLPLCQHWGDK